MFFSFQDHPQVSFSCTNRRGGALLSLPVETQRQDTRARGTFGEWMLQHVDSWLAFTRRLGLGIEQMEEIVLVTGCHLTRSWANVTFLEGQTYAQAPHGINVIQGHDINWHFSHGNTNTQGVVCSWGPAEPVCQFARNINFQIFRILKPFSPTSEPTRGPMPIYPRVPCCSRFRHIPEAAQKGCRTQSKSGR